MPTAPLSAAPTLSFLSLNPSNSKETILLLHSGFSSHLDFTFVTPLLSRSYHLLIPDLPGHGRSSSTSIPFSTVTAPALLADLVSQESPTGRAHIAGVSIGGFLGLLLASRYPQRASSLFITGCGQDLQPSFLTTWGKAFIYGLAMPTLISSVAWLHPFAHEWLYEHLELAHPESLQADQRAAARYGIGFALACGVLNGDFPVEAVRALTARTLLVAAGKDDNVEGTRQMGGELRVGNTESRAVRIEGMRHIWCLQDGNLFARAVEGWCMKEEILAEFEVL